MSKKLKNKITKLGLFVSGQSSQRPGMGLDKDGQPIEFLEDIINEVKKVLDPFQVERVRYLMLLNPRLIPPEQKKLLGMEMDRTDNAQLALFLLHVALWKKYKANESNIMPSVVMGHSAGEPIAGYISGAYALKDAAKYVFARGHYMNVANNFYPGGMLLVSFRKEDEEEGKEINLRKIEKSLNEFKRNATGRTKGDAQKHTIELACINARNKVVYSGLREELEWASLKLRDVGFKSELIENVAGAYHHSKAMASVEKALRELLLSAVIEIKKPAMKWILNFSGTEEDDEKKLMSILPLQVTHLVQWRKGIERSIDLGVTDFFQLGLDQTWIGLLRYFPSWQKIQEERGLLLSPKSI